MTFCPLVSIVIPCYNRERYIEDALNSALAQTYENIEIIVVDDGSTDNSVAVLSKYEDKITLIQQKNKGVSAARNEGLRAVSGEYVIFLDSDDWLSTDLVAHHVEAANKWPEVDIFCADFKSVDEDNQVGQLNRSNWPDQPEIPIELFLLFPPPFPACEMYKATTIKRLGGYHEDMKGFADSILRLNVILSDGKVVRTPNGHAVYRRVENSITKSGKQHYFAVKLIQKLRNHPAVKESNYLQQLIAKRLLRHRLRIWRNTLSFHTKFNIISISKFSLHLIKAMKMDPRFLIFIIRDKPWTMPDEEII